jgi:hypothetical protein
MPRFSDNEKGALRNVLAMDEQERKALQQELLLEKWNDWVGDKSVAEGYPEIKSTSQRADMALLLENQYRFQTSCERTVGSNGRVLLQDVTTGDEALPTKFSLPLVRRIYAPLLNRDFGDVQPMSGPTSFVFWIDFIRETGSTNLLSLAPSAFITAEGAVPAKGKTKLVKTTITAQKQLIGSSITTEAIEDARAILGLDVEQELLNEFAMEIQRDLLARHLNTINTAARSGTANGSNLPTIPNFAGPNSDHALPNIGSASMADYKTMLWNALVNADLDFQRVNKKPSDSILCGLGLAALLGKIITATSATNPVGGTPTNELGFTNYGVFAGRWTVVGTEFLPDAQGVMYSRNPSRLQACHVYAPYVPVQVMPTVYGGYDASTGNYQNTDETTRNLRERSAEVVTKPYGYQPISGPAGGLAQF